MADREFFVILNPNAAKGRAKKQGEMIKALLEQGGNRVVLVSTKKGEGAERLAWQATYERRDAIIAAGGDGTVNEVVNGMLKAATEKHLPVPSLGVIPIGRGNDFAWGMQIPKSLPDACKTILEGTIRIIDAGISYGGNYPEGRFFVNGLGVGFEPLVNFLASEFKHVSGTLSYVLALIRILIHYPAPYAVDLSLDGKTIQLQTQQLSICNGRRMGSAFLMGPDAIFDDGLFDVVYANAPVPSWRLLPLALTFFKGGQVKRKEFRVARVQEVTMVSHDNPMPVHVDGEELSKGCMRFSSKLLKGILPVFC
ncbi:MAG: diacylglycerol/lipid kinase family protein [Sphaerochaetaceae bacterium]